MKGRIMNWSQLSQSALIQELRQECNTISLSLDNWTSQNHIAIIGIIGYWITPDFKCQVQVLEFREINGEFYDPCYIFIY